MKRINVKRSRRLKKCRIENPHMTFTCLTIITQSIRLKLHDSMKYIVDFEIYLIEGVIPKMIG